MKKCTYIMATLLLLLIFNVNNAFATPINKLDQGQSVLGISVQGGSRSTDFFVQSQMTSAFSVAFQNTDWIDSGNMSDFSGQFNLNESQVDGLRFIIGVRNYESKSSAYLGGAVIGDLTEVCYGYVSAITGSGFQEVQAGANYGLSDNAYLNVNYRLFHDGGNRSGVGIGINCVF